ncbi:MAG: hypothetical protein AAGJ82_09080 [Bacteroidota bacterium]
MEPERLIAADVNQSGSVTVVDLIQMRKLILNYYDEFPNAPSWRFIPADYEFPIPTNPWFEPFPTQMELSPTSPVANFVPHFTGIKIGDVNGSVIPN